MQYNISIFIWRYFSFPEATILPDICVSFQKYFKAYTIKYIYVSFFSFFHVWIYPADLSISNTGLFIVLDSSMDPINFSQLRVMVSHGPYSQTACIHAYYESAAGKPLLQVAKSLGASIFSSVKWEKNSTFFIGIVKIKWVNFKGLFLRTMPGE